MVEDNKRILDAAGKLTRPSLLLDSRIDRGWMG